MNRKSSYMSLAGIVLAVVMMLTAVTGCSRDDSEVSPDEETALATQVETTSDNFSATSNEGTREGIEVHGHWTIEVQEPDGTLVSHDEFENDLQSAGKLFLLNLLARENTMGLWEVHLSNTVLADVPFRDGDDNPIWGFVVESNSLKWDWGPWVFNTLTVTALGSPDFELVLTGTATAQVDGAIDSVSTYPNVCNNTTAPSDCVTNASQVFTSTTFATPIDVLAGQQILVEVIIQFS